MGVPEKRAHIKKNGDERRQNDSKKEGGGGVECVACATIPLFYTSRFILFKRPLSIEILIIATIYIMATVTGTEEHCIFLF
jgi:hypothetical protein